MRAVGKGDAEIGGQGRPKRQAQQHFTELILLAGLVTICWPRIEPVGTTRPLAAVVDRHLAIHYGVDSRSYRSTAAPIDALACAGPLQVADRLLTADYLPEALSPLAPEENRTRSDIPPTRHLIWDKNFKKQRSACSERFQLAADTIAPNVRRTGKDGLRLPSIGVGPRPEHFPACLPQALAERHLNFLSDITSRCADAQPRSSWSGAHAAAASPKPPTSSGSTPRARGSATRNC
ncbi:hypothetical protein ID875_11475 [Streptomyces globisporus]|uniref:Uncharacterized protein n=1 Tax=Streptomyces globisporus TaxID=1908 RepID=A0A927GMY5_STRGL|nr:hypothetical protein [Streptomyces globisporus]